MNTIELNNLDSMKVNQLKDLCVNQGLPSSGRKADLIKRLKAKALGGDERVVRGGKTLCPYCQNTAIIKGSRTICITADKKRLVQYRLKCNGKRNHRFTVKQLEG